MRSISVHPFCDFIRSVAGGGERGEKNKIATPAMIRLCVYDCVCRHFRFSRPGGNSRKTICVSTQTINNRRRRSRTRWFMVNLNWIFIRSHARIFARHGTRGRASRLAFAQWFQLRQLYPDRMHFAKIYCPRAFMLFLSMCARAVCGEIFFADNRNKFNTHLYYLSKISFKTELAKAPYCLDKFWITFYFYLARGEFVFFLFFFFFI